MKRVKTYRLYVYVYRGFNEHKYILEHNNYDWLLDNMMHTVERIYNAIFKDCVESVMQFDVCEVYDDGSEKCLKYGRIKTQWWEPFQC